MRISNRGEWFGSLIAGFALLAGACGSLGACHHDAPPDKGTGSGACCHRDCVYLDVLDSDKPFQPVHSTRMVTHITESGTCDFEVFWPLPDGEGGSFHATLFPSVRDVFPVHGELMQLIGSDRPIKCARPNIECAMPPYAEALFNPPAFAALSPSADDVFIPVGGHATLDGNTYVQAEIESRPDGGDDGEVTVIFRGEEKDGVRKRMRAGDSFPWSGRVASIVRIVDIARKGPIGWVEIHLAAPSGVTKPK